MELFTPENLRLGFEIGALIVGAYLGIKAKNYKAVLDCVVGAIETYNSTAIKTAVKDKIHREGSVKKGFYKKADKIIQKSVVKTHSEGF